MKCPHCNFEREEDFNFCPVCGLAMNINHNNFNQPVYYPPNYYSGYDVAPIQIVSPYPNGLNEATYKEKKKLRLDSRMVGGAFLALLVLSSFISEIFIDVLKAIGLSNIQIHNLVSNPYFSQLYHVVVSSFIFIFPFTLFFKCAKYKISDLVDYSLPKTKTWFPIFLMGIGFCSFANIANSIAATFFSNFGVNYVVNFGEEPEGFYGIALSVLATAFIPALVEEFACRGVMLGALRKYGDGFAVMVSSILFGAIHGNFQQMPFTFLVGLIMGFVTVKCESIWPAMLIHFYNNLSSVIFDYAFQGVDGTIQSIIYSIYVCVCLFVGLVGVLLLKNNADAFKLKPSTTEASTKQKYIWFFTTELVIIVLSLCLYDSLQFFTF